MNRREFNTSLAAVVASPLLPLSASATTRTVTLPAGTYAWAQLIARAQARCSPAMLARHLRIKPEMAHQLFDALMRDGVLRAPGISGVAVAAKPINATGTRTPRLNALRRAIDIDGSNDQARPLVKDTPTCQMCDDIMTEEDTHASAPEPVQDIPQER